MPRFTLSAVCAGLALLGSVAQAANSSWAKTNANESGDWSVAGNWTNGVPGVGDTASITANNANTFTSIVSDVRSIGTLNLWNRGTGQAWLALASGGQLTISTAFNISTNAGIRLDNGGKLITSTASFSPTSTTSWWGMPPTRPMAFPARKRSPTRSG